MNIKISEDSVTFKISEHELNELLTAQKLEKKVQIGTSEFVMLIDPCSEKYFDDSRERPLKLILDRSESCLMLCTTMDELKRLSDMGKNRDGLSSCVNGLNIFLQVDLRTDTRAKTV
jgi:hypothetical protein